MSAGRVYGELDEMFKRAAEVAGPIPSDVAVPLVDSR